MELAYELSMTWLDPRLLFYNLKDQIELNVLTKDEKIRIWTPILVFDNTREKSPTEADDKRKGFIRKIGREEYSELDESLENI